MVAPPHGYRINVSSPSKVLPSCRMQMYDPMFGGLGQMIPEYTCNRVQRYKGTVNPFGFEGCWVKDARQGVRGRLAK